MPKLLPLPGAKISEGKEYGKPDAMYDTRNFSKILAIYGLHFTSGGSEISPEALYQDLADSKVITRNMEIEKIRMIQPRNKSKKDFIIVYFKNGEDVKTILASKSQLNNSKFSHVMIKPWVPRGQYLKNDFEWKSRKASNSGNPGNFQKYGPDQKHRKNGSPPFRPRYGKSPKFSQPPWVSQQNANFPAHPWLSQQNGNGKGRKGFPGNDHSFYQGNWGPPPWMWYFPWGS